MRFILLALAVSLVAPVQTFAETCCPLNRGEAVVGNAAWNIQDCGGLKVVHLVGSPKERARKYGELIKEGAIKREILDFFLEAPTRVARGLPTLYRLFSGLVYASWTTWNDIKIPSDLRGEVHALADELGVRRNRLERGMAVPDAGAVATGLFLNADREEPPLFGCTSIARALPDGTFAIGRNLDYNGVGIWDKSPLLTVSIPPEGSTELRHAALAADGIHYGSITGFNEAGISLFLHQAFFHTRIAHTGIPVYFIGEQVLRQARTLDEAIELLSKNRPIPMWFFVLSDLKTGEAAVVESSATTFFVRRMEGRTLAQANHLRDPDAVPREALPWSNRWHSKHREELALASVAGVESLPALIEAIRGALEKQADPTGNLSTHASILNPETIQSLILSSNGLSDWRISAGVGRAPVSSGPAVNLKIQDLWKSEGFLDFEPVAQRVTAEVRARQQRVSRAFALAQSDAYPADIAEALASDPSAPAHLARAIYAYRDKRFDAASTESDQGLEILRQPSGPNSFADQLIIDDLKLLSLLSGWHVFARAPLPERWQELSKTEDPRLRRWIGKLKGKKGSKPPRVKLGYNFFTGRLQLP